MKVIVDDKIPFIRGQVERLADEVVYLPGAAIGPADVHDADALIVRTRTLCDRRLLEGSRVRFVATATIGYDHLDTQYLDEAGIQWTNCPGCNATSVAQYVRNSLFEAEREGLVRLSEAVLGIIGFGHVGTAVFEAMRPYVRRIIVNDPPLFGNEERRMKKEGFANALEQAPNGKSLHEIAVSCDIITLHVPLTSDGPWPTRHLVDEAFIQSLKRRPLMINAARGGVVDERALEHALDEGLVRQAIIDTWEDEPAICRTLLRKAFIATPHIAGYSADGKANATRMSLEALAKWMEQDSPTPNKEQKPTFDIQPPHAEPERTGLNYSPMEDSRRLKDNPAGFEQQRGQYPLRRE